VAFLRFTGLEPLLAADGPAAADGPTVAGPAVAADRLDHLVRAVQQAADRHAITFLGTDIDAGGGKIILTTGAPESRGNDEERMLLALREVITSAQPLPIKIGVSVGDVFAGDIGPSYRRAYTVMGDAVNLAARVMSRAEVGDVLATPAVLAASRTAFETTPVEPFLVKGKQAPVTAAVVGAARGRRDAHPSTELPFVGRAGELAVFDEVLEEALHGGSGRLIEVVGEAGIGKSRLLAGFQARANGRLETHTLVCELHRASTPYGATRRLFRNLLGIDLQAGPGEAGRQLLAVLREGLPALVPWAPLLAITFGAELPPTDATANLEAQYRRPRLNAAVAELLAWRWPGAVLLIGEDTQWMDEASADVIRSLAGHVARAPWILCFSRRELDEPFASPGDALVLQLKALDEASTVALASAATDAAPFPAHEMALLVERSGGNPLFLQELVAAAVEGGGLDELPDSVETLVTARIDRLPRRERTVLRHVSVLGQRFPRALATAVLPGGVGVDDEVWAQLDRFFDSEGDALRFRHGLIRDVAYDGLRYRLRRHLHAKAGDLIAEASDGRPEDQAALLSFHYFHAQRHQEAWRYSLAAAEQARRVYANAEAARSLERAIEAARGVGELPSEEVARAHERLGDVREHMGAYREAATAYRAARRLLPPDEPVDEARLMLKLARQHGRLSRFSQARRWIRRGLQMLEDVDGPAAGTQRAQLTVWNAHFCEEEGRHRLALRWCRRSITAAESVGDLAALAHAHRVLGRSHGALGDLEAATASMCAPLTLYEQLDDLTGQGAMTNNLGALAYWVGRWGEAREHFGRSLEISQRIGDEEGVAGAQKNLGLLLAEQGRLSEAAEVIGASLRSWQAAGYRASVARAQRELAWIAARSGRHGEAFALLQTAHAAFQGVGAEVDDIDTLAVVAECHLLKGEPVEALAIVDEALAHDLVLGGVSAQSPLLHRLRGYALLRTGRSMRAREALDASLEAARARDMDYEAALTLRALAELASTDEGASNGLVAETLQAESGVILARLDVIWVPEIPAVAEQTGRVE
jgi:class 3 adenylate cyclase/tetratricopeptide (TPR) repeat protein